MLILLAIAITVVVISLRLTLSGLELAEKVGHRGLIKNTGTTASSSSKLVATSLRVASNSSKVFLRGVIFLLSRVRDLVLFLGGFIVLLDVIIGLIVVASAAGFLVLYTTSDESGNIIFNPEVIESLINTGGSTTKGSADGKDDSSVGSTVGKPEGISDASWSSADATGRKVAAFASNAIINPPNGVPIIYQQGNTGVGVADCSVFVCAVLEGSLHKTFGGADAPNGYDFAVNRKSDLAGYATTYGMDSCVAAKPECNIGSTSSSADSLRSGDILLKNGHVGIYVGRRDDGKDIMVHASTDGGSCSSDIALTDRNKDTGFSEIWGTFSIIRPSILLT